MQPDGEFSPRGECMYMVWDNTAKGNGVFYSGAHKDIPLTSAIKGRLVPCSKPGWMRDLPQGSKYLLGSRECLCSEHVGMIDDAVDASQIKASIKATKDKIRALPFEDGYTPKAKAKVGKQKNAPDCIDEIRIPTEAEREAASAAMDSLMRSIEPTYNPPLEIFGRSLVLKPIREGSSASAYFDRETGIKLAITLEGVKRMGPDVIRKIVARA